MRSFEITYPSVNSVHYRKSITALIMEPDNVTPNTGAMLFTHGWGGNRFQHQDKMECACERNDLVCISVEYRMSGYDFDPVTGAGAYLPYDASFYQTFDVLAGLRKMLELRPVINRKRLFHYGGSQGGGISLLSSIFVPQTFAFVYASSPVTRMDEEIRSWTGREFANHEISIRDMIEHADLIQCPVFLEHGTSDSTVPHDRHTQILEGRLKALNKKHKVVYYEGGEHNLEPAITKLDAFKAMGDEPLRTLINSRGDDFATGSTVKIPCGDKTLHIDWSKPADSLELFTWKQA